MEITSYDPKKVSVIVDGRYLTGFMDGTFVTCAKNADNRTAHVGATGDVTYSENADNTGTITVTLKHTSSSLGYLRSKAKSKQLFPVQVIDANADGRLRAGGTKATIIKLPDEERGAEVSGVEIQFHVADYDAK